MREIKFRVWDKANRTMTFGGSFRDIYPTMNREEWSYVIDTPHPDDCELMQYTGLKDKNGVEIYEGDILKGDWSITDDIEKGVVEFYGGAFRFKPAGLPLEFGYYRKESGVIGNIYENPELLEEV